MKTAVVVAGVWLAANVVLVALWVFLVWWFRR
jgi:hypothetical protein